MQLRRIGVFSLAKLTGVAGLLYGALLGLLYGTTFGFGALVLLLNLGSLPQRDARAWSAAIAGGVLVACALAGFVFAYLQGLVLALFGNLVLRITGGLQLEIDGAEPPPPPRSRVLETRDRLAN